MAARRTSSKYTYPEHVVTQAKAAAGILGVTPVFGDETYLAKQNDYARILELYKKERCGNCKKSTQYLGWKSYHWVCKDCFVGPKQPTNSNEE